ncbi:hypothetical protein D3C77_775230 [compost metagenome]
MKIGPARDLINCAVAVTFSVTQARRCPLLLCCGIQPLQALRKVVPTMLKQLLGKMLLLGGAELIQLLHAKQ